MRLEGLGKLKKSNDLLISKYNFCKYVGNVETEFICLRIGFSGGLIVKKVMNLQVLYCIQQKERQKRRIIICTQTGICVRVLGVDVNTDYSLWHSV
jgi:hypothetical protein